MCYYVEMQSQKKYSSIDALKDIQNIPLYVCLYIYINCIHVICI